MFGGSGFGVPYFASGPPTLLVPDTASITITGQYQTVVDAVGEHMQIINVIGEFPDGC